MKGPLQGATWPPTPHNGHRSLWHHSSPTRYEDACMVELSHVSAVRAGFRKSPDCSGLERAQRQARQLPAASCCWQSHQCSSCPNSLFSKQHLHTKQGVHWNIRGLVSWQPVGRQCLSRELCSLSCLTCPATDAVGMSSFFLRGKQGRTNHLHKLIQP